MTRTIPAAGITSRIPAAGITSRIRASEVLAARRAGENPCAATSLLSRPRPDDATAKAISPDGRQPGETISFGLAAGVKMKFAWCPPGMFLMGSPDDEAGRETIERRHSVFLTEGYWMGVTTVTQAQWMLLMGTNPSAFALGPEFPVETVSWNDCQEFVRRMNLSAQGIGTFALPTEAQWEHACRAGTETPYVGDLDAMGWYAANSQEHTHPVGLKAPNAWGLHDMHGNVFEWCQDSWVQDFPPDGMDPVGPPDKVPGQHPHAMRGGAWCYPAEVCRSASRRSNSPDFAAQLVGLRLVFLPGTHGEPGLRLRRKAP